MKKPKRHWYFYVPIFYSAHFNYKLVLAILRYIFIPTFRLKTKLEYYQQDNLSVPEIKQMPELKIEWMFFGFYAWKGSIDYW